MRIRRLDITGFKSFTDRTVFAFEEGVTGIVGPNGCGKSNVVDAIRWVMGEQSAKHLRGRSMEDVIFNGSESRAPLSMAEVSLTLAVESQDQLAPQYAGFPEVTVTRRLFRNGESEYLINRTHCRLLDVTELFLGTGVGTRAYSIVEQGRVGLIVSAKPEDRRSMIEEAAGITKYKSRRKVAERKLDYTQQNLLRVSDIVQELEKQLESLGRQARKAEKYKKLKAQIREVELHLASHRFLELHAQSKVLREALEALGAEERQSLAQVRSGEDSIAERRAGLEALTRLIQELQARAHALEGQLQLDDQNLAHWEVDSADAAKRMEQADRDLQALGVRRKELDAAILEGERELSRLLEQCKEDEGRAQAIEQELARVTQVRSELTAGIESERVILVELAAKLANHETNLANLSRRRSELEAERARKCTEVELLRREEATLSKRCAELSKKVDATRQLALQLSERKGMEESSLGEVRGAFAENEIQVISLREELSDRRARLASLEEIQRNHEGLDRGVRAVLRRGGESETTGILGLVADIISAPPRFEKAIEAALGERLQHVIVEDQAQALDLADYLKAASEGRASFVPLAQFERPMALAQPDLSRLGVLAAAHAEVQCDARCLPMIQRLLGDVVIVSDLKAAREYAAATGNKFTLVTLEGELLSNTGVITGGTLEGPAVGALQKKREIVELQKELSTLESRYNQALTQHYALRKEIEHAEGVLKGLAQNHHAEELTLVTQERDLHKASEDLLRVRERIAAASNEERQSVSTLSKLDAAEQSSRGEMAHGQSDRDSRESRVRRMGLELETLKDRADQLSHQLTSARVKAAANAERREAGRKEFEQLSTRRREIAGEWERLSAAKEEDRAKLDRIAARVRETVEKRADRTRQLSQLRLDLEQAQQRHTQGADEVREQERALRDLRLRLDELTQGLSQHSLRERELALELEHLIAQIRERHQVALESEVHRFHLLPSVSANSETQLKDLRAQVERMGEINLLAVEEHADASSRYQFLCQQKKDLEEALERLKRAIHKIDRTSRQRFERTFEVVNEKFQQVFPRLFGGGRAGLVLVEAEPGSEPGVDIVAQPPGKKLQNINLLSGGEKALTAVSLIFAIFLIKPSPFCLLDEVDAPLDEANVGRYNEMVKEMSRQSQFILVTHNKTTMEGVNTLYGVTMEEPGISKLVSVKMRDAIAATESQAA
jgi:chromosome segregation protein